MQKINPDYSPLLHLVHLPKTAGNSIWRELIRKVENCSPNKNHVIKLDTRNYVDQKYWNSLYFNKSKEYNNNTSFFPQQSLAILAHKEINNLILKFQRDHLILLHHHNSGAFRLPCEKNRDETSSHKWD